MLNHLALDQPGHKDQYWFVLINMLAGLLLSLFVFVFRYSFFRERALINCRTSFW